MPLAFANRCIAAPAGGGGSSLSVRQFLNWMPSPANSGGGENDTSNLAIGASGPGITGWPAATLIGSFLYWFNMTANDSQTSTYTSTVSDTVGNTYGANQDIANTPEFGESFSTSHQWCASAAAAINGANTTKLAWGTFGDYHSCLALEVPGVIAVPSTTSQGYTNFVPTSVDSITAPSLTVPAGSSGLAICIGVSGGDFATAPLAGTGWTSQATTWPFDLPFGPIMRWAVRSWSAGTTSIPVTMTPASGGGGTETYTITGIALRGS